VILDFDRLETLDPRAFRAQKPYPWLNPEGCLTERGFRRLVSSLPELELFEARIGESRRFGQQSHDRYVLEVRDDLPLAPAWRELLSELRSRRYRRWLARMIGTRSFFLDFHWHYTANGCSVAPHCDALRKLGSHIFYLNTRDDWNPAWGGQTLVLDEGDPDAADAREDPRLERQSAPDFDDFAIQIPSQAIGNHSLLFVRRGDSWHGMRELRCPTDRLRRVFIVVINRGGITGRVRTRLSQRAHRARNRS